MPPAPRQHPAPPAVRFGHLTPLYNWWNGHPDKEVADKVVAQATTPATLPQPRLVIGPPGK